MLKVMIKTTAMAVLMSLAWGLLVALLMVVLTGQAQAATPTEMTEMTEPVVSLVWLIVGGFIFAVLAGGGLAELAKKTGLAWLKEKADTCQEPDKPKCKKPWWWVAVLGAVAAVAGAGAMAIAAPLLDYPAGLGLLIGGVGGVNATWLWEPVQKAIKGIVGAVKGKFAGGGGDD
jgi:membrane protease YdiL (CAAX protease family)